MKPYNPNFRSRRRGVEIVEFALILPVVLAVLMAILEAGYMVKNQLTVANATRDGVRYAALGNNQEATRTRISNGLGTLGANATNTQITFEQTADRTSPSPAYTAWPADLGTGKNGVPVGNIVRIRVSYPHQPLTGFFSFMKNRNLVTAVTMLREAN